MKKITLMLICLVGSFAFAQVNINENFDGGTPMGWTDSYANSSELPCAGASERDNLFASSATGNLTTPNIVAGSNATDLNVSFDYKIVDYDNATFGASNNPTPAGWGSAELQYSTDDGVTWVTALVIDDANHTASASCATMMATIPAASLPTGSDVKLQIANTWLAGDYFFYIDNFVAQQDLGCVAPSGTATFVSEDCVAGTFDVDVDITNLGDGTPVLFDGTTSTPITAVGPFTLTYPIGTPVTFTLEHGASAACDISLGTISDTGLCPIFATVDCSTGTPVNTTLCYGNDADIRYVFTSTDGSPLRVDFIEGYFEDCCDDIIIYDGGEVTDPILFASDTNFNNDATGISAIATGDTILVQIVSDGSVSCASGSGSGIPLNFDVSCSTCAPAIATASVVDDCAVSGGFNIVVDITDLGSATDITLSDDQGSTDQNITAIGLYTFGPYVNGTDVTITLANDADAACTEIFSGLIQNACPPSNDECADAIALSVNEDLSCTDVTSATIEGATVSGEDEASCFGTEDDDVWFTFVAAAETHRIDLTNITGGTTDLYHSLWSGACGTLTNLLCSDPNSSVATGLTVGETYTLRVYSWTATPGQTTSFDVCIGTLPPPPANDECADAIALTVNTDSSCTNVTSGTIASATASGEDEAACFGTENDDVWFTFVATADTHDIELSNITGGTTDLYHSVWSGDCGTLTNLLCSDPNTSTVDGLTIGETYTLRVYSWTSTAGQTSSFDVCISTPCTAEAGTLTADATPVALVGGTATISATVDTAPVEPAGYTTAYVLTSGANLLIVQLGTMPSFDVTVANDYTIHTLVYDAATLDPTSLPAGATGVDVNALLIQGGGSICAALDVAGAPITVLEECLADAGTLTADASPVSLAGGTATISATANGDSVVPTDYDVTYVLTSGATLIIEQAGATPSFNVTAAGDYTIHTLVAETTDTMSPNYLDLGVIVFGTTTGGDVLGLVTTNNLCASLDVAGAPITVLEECLADAGTLTADATPVALAGGTATISATANGDSVVPTDYDVTYVLTSGPTLIIEQAGATPSFDVTAAGDYTIHTLVAETTDTMSPNYLDLGVIVFGTTTGGDVLGLVTTNNLCASLDVTGAPITVLEECLADAGTLTADASPVELPDSGSVTISATPNGDSVVPTDYDVTYVLTSGPTLIIEQAGATPSFDVTAVGDYTIHTLVAETTDTMSPNYLDLGVIVFGTTTGGDVLGLVTTNNLCASLDVTGAPITVEDLLSVGDEANVAAFTYFPNPVQNTLTLNARNTIETVTMYNMLGQEVLRVTPNSVDSDLDMSTLESGPYFVQVTIASVTQTIRVIKQ
ncbi:MAG: T9SS type A sorting domain-containing protein [Winogradskyella sp.]|uniref:T9SS type A sorting domain-containing protein n=1 Tax=Winogradskyella sp. TaxID=1883156 RepID=UPI00385D0444